MHSGLMRGSSGGLSVRGQSLTPNPQPQTNNHTPQISTPKPKTQNPKPRTPNRESKKEKEMNSEAPNPNPSQKPPKTRCRSMKDLRYCHAFTRCCASWSTLAIQCQPESPQLMMIMIPQEQKMRKRHPPRLIYHQVY